MRTVHRQILMDCFKVFDIALTILCFFIAAVPVLRQSGAVSFAHFLSMRVKIQNFVLFCALYAVWHCIFFFFGLYRSKRLSTRRAEILDIIKATSAGTLVFFLAALIFHVRMITPVFLLVFWLASSVSLVLTRLALRYALSQVRKKGRNLRCMLIAGTNDRAIEFARNIEVKAGLGYRIVGFVDEEWTRSEKFRQTGYSVVCGFQSFAEFLRQNVVDELLIALPMRSCYGQAAQMAALCGEHGVTVRFASIFDPAQRPQTAKDLDYSTIVPDTGIYGGSMLVKRAIDFLTALVLLIVFAPVFLITAILIRLTSPGPVFFVQKRLGLNKRIFSMYKFRTMYQDAERRQMELEHLNEATGSVFKIKNDPRVTRAGKFLRKASIDELPQLWNVFTGDMSLVGPRPLPSRDYARFDRDWHRRRFSVRPGITCLWQVNGRSSIPFDQWMELDLRYIDHWSLGLDLRILLKTIPAVLTGSGAA